MEKKIESAEEKLALIRKGFPKDPCKHCAFGDENECGCDALTDYQAALQHLHDLGIYDLMQDRQRINQNKIQIVWIQREISKKNEQIVSIQSQIDELEKKCADALTQLKEAADEAKNKKNGDRNV